MADQDATLNPSDKSAGVTLSGGNLTGVVAGGSWASVRSTQSKSTGKVYFEVTLNVSMSEVMIGIGTAAKSLETYPGSSPGAGYSYYSYNGYVYYDGSYFAYGASLAIGNILCVAVDYDAGKIWYGKNGVWPNAGNPETGANPAHTIGTGTYFPMIGAKSGGAWTVNFGASTFAYTPPSGFTTVSEIVTIPVASLTLTAVQGIQIFPVFAPVASLSLTPFPPSIGLNYPISNVPQLILTPFDPTLIMYVAVNPPAGVLTLTAKNPSYVWVMPPAAVPIAQIIFTCTLTGDAETPAVADLVLPMSSFQATMRDGDPSYLSCVIPNSPDYADWIVARTHGDIMVKKGYRLTDGTESLEEIARVHYESLQIDRGARNDSAIISGHKTVTSSSPKDRSITGLSFYGLQAEGSRRIRGDVDTFLRCGDTVLFDLEGVEQSFIVGDISYNVAPNQAYMDVTEAWETVPEVVIPPEVETSQEYELVGPGVIVWSRTHWYLAGLFYGSDPGGGAIEVNTVSISAYHVDPVDPTKPPVATGLRGIESPIFVVSAGYQAYAFGDPGGGCTFTVAADYTVDGVTRTAYKSVVLSP